MVCGTEPWLCTGPDVMDEESFYHLWDNEELDDDYAEFILEHSKGDRIIGNGHQLTEAMESGYLFDEFKAFMTRAE